MKKNFYAVIEQIERILNKAKGKRYDKLKTHFEAKFYPYKVAQRFGYEGQRDTIVKFTTIF